VPEATRRIYSLLGLADDLTATDPAELQWGGLNASTDIQQTEGIFPRIDKANVMTEIKANTEQAQAPAAANAEATTSKTSTSIDTTNPAKADDNFITIDDFLKVELRVGEIKVAERIPNADKLLRFEIDLGEEKPRQILAGLAEYYEPEKLIGRKVVVVANLKPRKMRGLESQGMICAASLGQEDTPAIATFIENVDIGARLK